ncbi:MAG: integrase [Polaromonas sp.]
MAKFDTVTARDALKARHAPYWLKIRASCHLGYRKTTADSKGAWIARIRDDGTGKYQLHSLGSLDTVLGHRRYDEAVKLAMQWFEHRSMGGASKAITVADACRRYVEKLHDAGRVNTADDAEARFKRWVYSDAKLGNMPMMKLTPGALQDWRTKLAKTPAIHQDKTKTSTKPRAASSLNRDMAVLKTALNLAREDGYATSDNAWTAKLKPVKDAEGRRDCYLDIGQRRALIAQAAPDLAALLSALSLVPLRPGAIAGLTVSNFDKRLGVLTVGKDKAGRDRKITLPASTAKFFAVQAKDKLPTAPLIARADGKFWDKDAWKGPFKKAAVAANAPLDATAYALRHNTITDLIALHRLDTMTVAQLSGTSLAMIEKHYGHLLRDHAATALASLAL